MNSFFKILDKILFKDDNFGLALYTDESLSFDNILDKKLVYDRKIGNAWVPKTLMVQADPFLFVHTDTLYLFYESMKSGGKGYLTMTKTDNLKQWTEPIIVLEEPWHLSFPFVFEMMGDVYMIPESQAIDEIRLYKANETLTKFHFVKTLLHQEHSNNIVYNYSDSHLFLHNGYYYLFTSVYYKWDYHLELYFTDDLLLHPFKKHPMSPVHVGNEFGRSGGRILQTPYGLFRVSQDCKFSYGGNISLIRINQLSPQNYSEEIYIKNAFQINNKKKFDGGHQLDIAYFKGKFVYATDYRQQKWCWYQRYKTFENYFCK